MQKKISRVIAVYNHFGENIVTNPKLVLAIQRENGKIELMM